MSKHSKGSLSDWLVAHCNLNVKKAEELEIRLRNECFIESIGSLRQCVTLTPDVLDQLNLPNAFLLNINDQLGIMNSKQLSDVTVSELRAALANIFEANPEYAETFFRSRISGFVLSQISTSRELIDWGINSKEHALVLLGHVSTWKMSGIPKYYLRIANRRPNKEVQHCMLLPRKRARDENVPPSDTAPSVASRSNETICAPVAAHMTSLSSPDQSVRIQALEKLYKEAEKDHTFVDMFVHTGLIDKLLALRKDPVEEVVWKLLRLLDVIVQKGDTGTLAYLVVDKSMVSQVLALVGISHRVRMGILRLVLSIAHTLHVVTLLQTNVMQGIVSLYFTAVIGVKAREAEETRHRTSLALKATSRAAELPQHTSALLLCLPALRDILEIDHGHQVTIPAACSVLKRIIRLSAGGTPSSIQANGSSSSSDVEPVMSSVVMEGAGHGVPDEIIKRILPTLINRLTDKNANIQVSTLSVLSVLSACCRAEQVPSLNASLKPLQRFLKLQDPTKEVVRLAAVKAILSLCGLGGAAVSMLIDANAFPSLLELIQQASRDEGVDEEVRETVECAAKALLAAVKNADDAQLVYFLRINVYSLTLRMVVLFSGSSGMLLQVLDVLHYLIRRVEGIDQAQLTAEEERCEEEAWVIVQKLAAGYVAPARDDRRMVEDDGVEERTGRFGGEVVEATGALVRTACAFGILEVAPSKPV